MESLHDLLTAHSIRTHSVFERELHAHATINIAPGDRRQAIAAIAESDYSIVSVEELRDSETGELFTRIEVQEDG